MNGFRRALLLLAVAPVVALAGCGEPPAKPELTVLGLGEMRADVLATETELRLKVLNPHPDAIQLEGMTVVLNVAGERFAKGAAPVSAEIPAFSSAEVSVPVTISSLNLFRTVRSATKSREMEHGLEARVTYRVSGSRHTAFIKESGTLSFE